MRCTCPHVSQATKLSVEAMKIFFVLYFPPKAAALISQEKCQMKICSALQL
jgi:hypothetical protein